MNVTGVTGEAADQVCDLLAEQLSLCYVKGTTGNLDYVTAADLSDWALDRAALKAAAQKSAAAPAVAVAPKRRGFSATRPTESGIEGMAGKWWLSAEADGLDAAGLLFPDRLTEIAGAVPVVAVPAQGALLFWVPGDPELDKVMAVAARRIYDSADQRVGATCSRRRARRSRTRGPDRRGWRRRSASRSGPGSPGAGASPSSRRRSGPPSPRKA